MKTYNFQITEDVRKIIEEAACRGETIRNIRVVTSEYLMAEIIESDQNKLGQYLMQCGYFDKGDCFDADFIEEYLAEKEFIETILEIRKGINSKGKIILSDAVIIALKEAENVAQELGMNEADINCLIYALINGKNEIWKKLFPVSILDLGNYIKQTVTMPEEMQTIFSKEALKDGTFGQFDEKAKSIYFNGKKVETEGILTNKIPEALIKMEANLETNENLILGRDNQIEKAFDTMQKMYSRNVILVGREGTGKTAIVEGLVERIARKQCPKAFENASIFQLNIDSLMKDTKYLGQSEEKFDEVKKYLEKHENVILFIDEIHNIIGMGRTTENSYDFANSLKPILTKGNVKVIGATTDYEYDRYLSRDPAFCRRFEKIKVEEPSTQELNKMLSSQVNKLERYHGIQVSSEMLAEVTAQATAFDYLTANPSRTMSLLDIAMVKAKNRGKDKLDITSILCVHKSEINRFNNMGQKEKENIAIHEAGHFVVTKELQNMNRVVTVVSIIPARDYLGVNCLEYANGEISIQDRNSILNEIAVSLAGDVATQIKGFSSSSGKSGDIENATRYARKMILEYGLIDSETFGEYNSFTINGEVQTEYLSENQKELLTKEINKILAEAGRIATNVLNKNIEKLEVISKALIKYGILRKEQLDKLYNGDLKLEDIPEPEINLIL